MIIRVPNGGERPQRSRERPPLRSKVRTADPSGASMVSVSPPSSTLLTMSSAWKKALSTCMEPSVHQGRPQRTEPYLRAVREYFPKNLLHPPFRTLDHRCQARCMRLHSPPLLFVRHQERSPGDTISCPEACLIPVTNLHIRNMKFHLMRHCIGAEGRNQGER